MTVDKSSPGAGCHTSNLSQRGQGTSLSVQGLQEPWLWVLALPEVEGKFLSLTCDVITAVN